MKENEYSKRQFIELKGFINDLLGENDRAAVILGTAKIDYLLYRILLKSLIPNPSGKDDLLDTDSPLSTFSARINMIYRLGLITKDFCRALHILRKIRNQFAHEYSKSKLNSSPHKDRVQELINPFEGIEYYEEFKTSIKKQSTDIAIDFKVVVAAMHVRLDGILKICKPLKENEAIPLTYIK